MPDRSETKHSAPTDRIRVNPDTRANAPNTTSASAVNVGGDKPRPNESRRA